MTSPSTLSIELPDRVGQPSGLEATSDDGFEAEDFAVGDDDLDLNFHPVDAHIGVHQLDSSDLGPEVDSNGFNATKIELEAAASIDWPEISTENDQAQALSLIHI